MLALENLMPVLQNKPTENWKRKINAAKAIDKDGMNIINEWMYVMLQC